MVEIGAGGGSIQLDAKLSGVALDKHVGEKLDLDTTTAAFGVSEVAGAKYLFSKFGSTGGIQRFKAGHHGSGHRLGAMIGCIAQETGDHLLSRVAGWIDELQ